MAPVVFSHRRKEDRRLESRRQDEILAHKGG